MKPLISSLPLMLLYIFLGLACTAQSPSPAETKASTEVTVSDSDHPPTIQRHPLYFSKDYGKSWENASYNLPKETEVSFIERTGNELIMATENKGVFISSNNRSNWLAINNGLPNPKINALLVKEDRIFASTYRQGIYEWNPQLSRWTDLNYDLPNQNVQSILVDNQRMIVGTDIGIFELDEQQKNWRPLFENVQVLSLEKLDENLIAGTSRGTLLSTDQGQSWNWIHEKGAIHYTHIVDQNIVEMYVSGDLFFSTDWGKTWHEVIYAPRYYSYVYEVIQVGNYWVMSNSYGIHQSNDQGHTWSLIHPTEKMCFFDLFVFDGVIYGGTREWDEFRGR